MYMNQKICTLIRELMNTKGREYSQFILNNYLVYFRYGIQNAHT
jgi:hypothetical protein